MTYFAIKTVPSPGSNTFAVADSGFPMGGAPTPGGANLLFGINFAENCMKMKEIGLKGARLLRPLDLLLTV